MDDEDGATPGLHGLDGAVLALRFASELAMLVALGWAAASLGGGVATAVLAAIAAPAVAILLWGRFVAPTSPHRLGDPRRLGLEVVMFGLATAGLVLVGHPWVALTFAAVVAATIALLRLRPGVREQEPLPDPDV